MGITTHADVRLGRPANKHHSGWAGPTVLQHGHAHDCPVQHGRWGWGGEEGAEGNAMAVFPALPRGLALSLVKDLEKHGVR